MDLPLPIALAMAGIVTCAAIIGMWLMQKVVFASMAPVHVVTVVKSQRVFRCALFVTEHEATAWGVEMKKAYPGLTIDMCIRKVEPDRDSLHLGDYTI